MKSISYIIRYPPPPSSQSGKKRQEFISPCARPKSTFSSRLSSFKTMSTFSPSKRRESNVSTPVRKGRHARTQAVSGSGSDGSSITNNHFNNVIPSSTIGLPPGLDPLRLDADDTFTKFGVREVQSIEASLRSSHEALTSRLRILVSERYRDMLGTANTLIDMSSSSSNLVNRLENVMNGIHSASVNTGNPTDGLTGLLSPVEEKQAGGALQVAQEKQSDLFAIAAATKLIAEAPDEVWTAIDSAIQTKNGRHASSPNSAGSNKRNILKGRDLSEFQAATNLRATWIFVLSNASWEWLQSQKSKHISAKDVKSLFPYIFRQHSALLPMKSYLYNAAEAGLSAWREEEHSDFVRSSTSYLATTTSLISLCLLEGHPIEHIFYLQKRKETLISQLNHSLRKTSSDELIVFVIRYIADSIIHSLRAFAPSNGESDSHLVRLCNVLKSSDHDRTSFPPSPLSVLFTLPSAAILTKHLPQEILANSQNLHAYTSKQGEDILLSIRKWSKDIQDEAFDQGIPIIIKRFSTIAKIGEIQGNIWNVYDRSCQELKDLWGTSDPRITEMVQDELTRLVQQIDALLIDRLKQICTASGEEISKSFINGTSEVLQVLKDDSNAESNVELDSTRFLFETITASDASSLESLEQRLRTRTKQVQEIISSTEERANLLAKETEAYTIASQKNEKRRVRDNIHLKRNGSLAQQSHASKRTERDDVSASFEMSLQMAKDSIAKRIKELSENVNQDGNLSLPSSLFLARLIVSLRRSPVFTVSSVQSHLNGTQSKELHEIQFLDELEKTQEELMVSVSDKMVKEALQTYQEGIGEGKIGLTDGVLKESNDLPVFPSSALLDALSLLSRNCQKVGIGYRSEELKLRKRLMVSFCRGWLQGNVQVSKTQHLFDLELIQVLLGFEHDQKISSDMFVKHIIDEMQKLKNRDLITIGIDEKQWSRHISTHLPIILTRIRLIVASIIVDEPVYVRAMKFNTTLNPVSTGSSIPNQVPPLPLLQLAKAKEPIPRIKPKLISSSR